MKVLAVLLALCSMPSAPRFVNETIMVEGILKGPGAERKEQGGEEQRAKGIEPSA